jgi:hypothetical protein
MSEYQYYEFVAIDRRLTDKEMAELRALSTRAEITPTSFVNEYHYGDFRGSPERLMEKYFDAFLYVANWGTRRLMFRLPRSLVDVEAVRPFYVENVGPGLGVHPEHVVFELSYEPEDSDGGSWEEGEGYLTPLLPLREELMAGDYRCLYLNWLVTVQLWAWDEGRDDSEVDLDLPEPPLPPGLGKPTAAQEALIEFLHVDRKLLQAATAGAGVAPSGPSAAELGDWVVRLPAAEKDDLLRRLISGEEALLGRELQRRFRVEQAAARGQDAAAAGPPRRTVRQLLAAWGGLKEEEQRREAEERQRQRRT